MDSGRRKTITRKYYSGLWYDKTSRGLLLGFFWKLKSKEMLKVNTWWRIMRQKSPKHSYHKQHWESRKIFIWNVYICGAYIYILKKDRISVCDRHWRWECSKDGSSKDIKLVMMSYSTGNWRRCRGEVSRRNTPSERISSPVCCFHSPSICCSLWNEDDRINISVAIFTATYSEKCYDSWKKYSSLPWLRKLSCVFLHIH